MKEQEDRNLSEAEQGSINEPGNVGEEELPAGIEKTDKCGWNYAANRIREHTFWTKLCDCGTKDWGYR